MSIVIPKTRPANADETQTTAELAITITCCVIVGITVVLRYLGRYALIRRAKQTKSGGEHIFGLDDVFNLLAVTTFIGLAIAVFIAIHRGMGTHLSRILYERGFQGFSDYNQSIYVSACFYNTTLGMIKLSVLSLYLRILRGATSNRMTIIVWCVFALVACNTIANVLSAIFQCRPFRAAWDVTVPLSEVKCIKINAFYLGNAITGVVTDAIVYLLSIPIVKPLHMDAKTKVGLLATMLLGAFAVVTSAVRLGFMPALLTDPDASFAMGVPMDWSVAEPAVGILVSSMPAIRAIRFFWQKPNVPSYGSSGGHSILKPSKSGHIQLYDVKSTGDSNLKLDDLESGKKGKGIESDKDNESEEHLVRGSLGKPMHISRTTELEVEYGPR